MTACGCEAEEDNPVDPLCNCGVEDDGVDADGVWPGVRVPNVLAALKITHH